MERVELAVGDGSRMNAFVAEPAPAASPKAAIIVLQEAFGVNGHIRDVAQRFARLGLTAIAPELFHRTAPGFEGSYGDFEAVRPNLQALTLEGIRVDIAAAYEWLTDTARIAPARIAAIGFCMGGRAVFTANAALALAAAVSFYGGGIDEDGRRGAASQHGPILMFWGGRDQHIPPEQRRAVADALSAAGKPHEQVVFSEADHGFFCDQRPSYHPGAARQAWALTLEFLRVCDVLS